MTIHIRDTVDPYMKAIESGEKPTEPCNFMDVDDPEGRKIRVSGQTTDETRYGPKLQGRGKWKPRGYEDTHKEECTFVDNIQVGLCKSKTITFFLLIIFVHRYQEKPSFYRAHLGNVWKTARERHCCSLERRRCERSLSPWHLYCPRVSTKRRSILQCIRKSILGRGRRDLMCGQC